METTSQLFLLLVLFFSVSGARATVENSEDDFEENNHRVDAEQEPFTKVTMSGGATSTLFRSCLDSGQTFDATFASIDAPGGITYTRYVPDSSMLALPITWENPVESVSDIFGCTAVAEAGGYSMFKYSATDGCQLATDGYDLEKVPDCEENEENAVFIKPTDADKCNSPYTFVTGAGCIYLSTPDRKYHNAAQAYCNSIGGRLFVAADTAQFMALRAYIKPLGLSMLVGIHFGGLEVMDYFWDENRPVAEEEWGEGEHDYSGGWCIMQAEQHDFYLNDIQDSEERFVCQPTA